VLYTEKRSKQEANHYVQDDAAREVGIERKTLADYDGHIICAICNGFAFEDNLTEDFGLVRKFNA
jgi:hypothetical protein